MEIQREKKLGQNYAQMEQVISSGVTLRGPEARSSGGKATEMTTQCFSVLKVSTCTHLTQ